MTNFAAIDFETANDNHSSVCSVGVVVVREGQEDQTFYSLIHPTPNYFGFYNMRVHGLSKSDTEHSPTFPVVWRQIEPLIKGLPLVAYNKAFDEDCLRSVFRQYKMRYPGYKFLCSYNATLKQLKDKVPNYHLDTVSAYCGYTMQHHHNALDDARACATIAKKIM